MFYYLIWKNSKKLTKNCKKPKQNCQKVIQNMLTSSERLSKFAEGFSSHYVQLCFLPLFFAQFLLICFPFILDTTYFFPFILCTIVLCTIMISLFVSFSEWNKN